MLEYCSTRRKKSNPINVNFSHAILNPIAEYGGLYAPSEIPLFSENCLNSMISLSYDELAIYILNKFGVDIPNEVIQNSLQCYDLFDYSYNPVPIVKLYENIYVAELWHGPTRSFKDMALQAFPYLLSNLATKFDKKYIIAVATSGDTGPAALEGFKDLPSTKIICYYPLEGTSSIQAEQMQKAQGANTKVFGVNTDFDGLQKELKDMLKSSTINEYLKYKGYELSAANSVNFGRIVFQVVYHFCSYFKMLKLKELKFGDSIDYIIPSGNFGNALAAFYAKMMGLPIGKIILASNENNILSDFVNRGIYDLTKRNIKKTIAPAMDILISSNIERLLFHLFGDERTFELMKNLDEKKYFELNFNEMKVIQYIFSADYATEDEIRSTIKNVYYSYNYLIDPHTATAFVVRDKCELSYKSVIFSTAEWTKFPELIADVFNCGSSFNSIRDKLRVDIPFQIKNLQDLDIIHSSIINSFDMKKVLLEFCNE